MGVWSVSKELIPAGKEVYGLTEAQVRESCRLFGPIPRHVLSPKQVTNRKELEKAISGCKFEVLESSLLDTASAPKEMSHRLVIVEVDEDFHEGEVTLASAQIEAKLAAKFDRQSDVKVKALLKASGGTSAIASFRGSILERTKAHEQLQQGGQFYCRDLDTNQEGWRPLPSCPLSADLPDHTSIGNLQTAVYGRGIYEYNLGGVDAVVKPGKLYQITVSKEHKINTRAMANVAGKMGGFNNLELYWAVDQQSFDPDFKKQNFRKTRDVSAAVAKEARGIKQYLLRLPNEIQLMAAHQDSDIEDTDMADA